jgi:hypothetical protein
MITNSNDATRSANEVRVQLNFTGFDRSPSEVTSQVGLVPAKTWEAGAFIERSKRTYASNGWRVSPDERYEDVERGVDALLSIITPRWDELRSLSCESRVELSIVLYVYESAPAVHLRRDQIARLTELNADIDVDLYCRSSQ